MTQKRTKLKANFGGWWRTYNNSLDDPKIQLLSDKQFRVWYNLMCLASKKQGQLPDINSIAFRLRLHVEEVSLIVEQLISTGLLELNMKTQEVTPHNWKIRQPNERTSRDRMRKLRAKNKDEKGKEISGDVTGDENVTSRDRDVPTSTSNSTTNRKVIIGSQVSDSATSEKNNCSIGNTIREGGNQ